MGVLDDIKKARTEVTNTVDVYLDGDVWNEVQTIRDEFRMAKLTESGLKSEVPRVKPRLEAALQKLEASKMTITVRTLPAGEWDSIMAESSSDDPDEPWDDTKMRPLLLAASCVGVTGPGFSYDSLALDEATALLDDVLGTGQRNGLYQAMLSAQMTSPAPFSIGDIALMQDIADDSTGASSTESLQAVI